MRTFLALAGSTLCSVAFQVSVALFPQTLQNYAWAVKYVWIACAGIWALWLLMHPRLIGGLWAKSKPEAPSVSPEAVVKESFNPTFTQTGPTINISVPPSTPEIQKPKPVEHTKPQKHIVLEASQPKYKDLTLDSGGTWQESHTRTGVSGLVIPVYYNALTSSSLGDIYVVAHLVLTDTDSQERKVVPAACWLGEYLNHVVLNPGDEKYILLVVIANNKYAAMHNKVEQYDYFNETTEGVKTIPLSGHAKNVQLVLMWGNSRKEKYSFEIPDLKSFKPIA